METNKEQLILELKPEGVDELYQVRAQLSEFVRGNFDLLYNGAKYLGHEIPEDYYAPRRIQIKDTRLNETLGVKYASGHKYTNERMITGDQLRQTVQDIQRLIDAQAAGRQLSWTLCIREEVTRSTIHNVSLAVLPDGKGDHDGDGPIYGSKFVEPGAPLPTTSNPRLTKLPSILLKLFEKTY